LGLMAAIRACEAGFSQVTILEQRTDYTRQNVPTLKGPIVNYLEEKGITKELGIVPDKDQWASFASLEGALERRAIHAGVRILRGVVATDVIGHDLRGDPPNQRYKRVQIRISEWDATNKVAKPSTESITADLLVIAVGGSAANNPLVAKLGFGYDRLRAKNYMAYALFNLAGPQIPRTPEDELNTQKLRSLVHGRTTLQTTDSRYLLLSLTGLTKADFVNLRHQQIRLRSLMQTIVNNLFWGERKILEGKNSVQVFKVRLQRARTVASGLYPAVLLGDAALTPHPQTGSGLVTGFTGFQALETLLDDLKKLSTRTASGPLLAAYNQTYGKATAERALKASFTIADNLHRLLTELRNEVNHFPQRFNPLGFTQFKNTITILIEVFAWARGKLDEIYTSITAGHADYESAWSDQALMIWDQLDRAYVRLKQLTQDIELASRRIGELSAYSENRGQTEPERTPLRIVH